MEGSLSPANGRRALAVVTALALATLVGCAKAPSQASASLCQPASGAVEIAGGTFSIGSNETYAEEGPVQHVTIQSFWLDQTEVTVDQFRKFVEDTGYVTAAERPVDPAQLEGYELNDEERARMLSPGGAVFSPDPASSLKNMSWWKYVPGANWRRPRGPQAPPADSREPVTQIAYEDAVAYAAWVGGRLPTEAEWEIAATAGDLSVNSQREAPLNANTWQGVFPVQNSNTDGYEGVAPVGCFAPNGNGLFDMVGNVWEWTSDNYQERHGGPPAPFGARSAQSPHSGVIKGGSYLCADNYCLRYRPAARQAQDVGLGTNHVGFRVAYDADPKPKK